MHTRQNGDNCYSNNYQKIIFRKCQERARNITIGRYDQGHKKFAQSLVNLHRVVTGDWLLFQTVQDHRQCELPFCDQLALTVA